jgi:tetratricopeptide (TPR) repeat protein
MIRSYFLKMLAVAAVVSALALAQTANPKQPKPKSKPELEAIQAIFSAQDYDSRIAAANNLITKFADTEFKATALYVAAESYSAKNDTDNAIVYAERCVEADPQFYGATLLIARTLAVRTREFDLDKEEKLGKAEKMAKQALEIIPNAPKPRPDLPDEQWAKIKNDFEAQCYEALGMVMSVRKKCDESAANFKKATELSMQSDPAVLVRMGVEYSKCSKYDEAIAALDKALADPQAAPQVKKVALDEKMRVQQKKGAAAPKQ